MTTLNVNFDHENASNFPVYCKYDGQFEPQYAYLALDIRTGELSADYNGNIGGGCTFDEFHNLVLRFTLPAMAHKDFIAEQIDENSTLFQKVLNGADVVWNDSNWVGSFDESARKALDKLEDNFEHRQSYDDERYIIDDLAEWLSGDNFSQEGESLEDFAKQLLSFDGDNGGYFDESFNDLDSMKEAVLDIWENDLYSGEDLPQHIAQQLIEHERGLDSKWVEELKEFAGI